MRFYGLVGYAVTEETAPGVWMETIEERPYYGDFSRNLNSRADSTNQVNDDILLNNRFSIIADPYAIQNFSLIKYIIFMDVKWKVTSVEVQYPRLILSTGGVYNENQS